MIADLVLWLTLVLLFFAFRIVLFRLFRGELEQMPSLHAFRRCFETGLRSDVCAATWAVLPSLTLTLIGFVRPLGSWHERVRRLSIFVILTLCAVVFVADVGYFAEYDNQFDHWIFGLIYDDRRAIVTTIWKSYPVIVLVLSCVVAVTIAGWLLTKLCRAAASADVPDFLRTKLARAITVLIIAVWAFVGAKVWLGRNLAGLKNAATTGDVFLNKIVLNPFLALRFAISQQTTMEKSIGLKTFLPDGDVRAAAMALYPEAQSAANLDDCVKRIAPGNPNQRPTHIFIVVMESYDAWSLEPEYADLHLTDGVRDLAKNGLHVHSFISSGISTIETLGVLITGLPFARVFVNYQPVVRDGVPTASAPIFKRLGYRPRFFYGGFLSWQRIGQFCREQGFDEVFGGDQMGLKQHGNEWGVDDEDLFRFVLDHTGPEPTFNVIMSTSYHPPYSVDVEKKGFDPSRLKASAIGAGLSKQQLRVLGHLWYSDKSVSEFALQGEQKLERPVFVVTGDHYSRKQYVSARPVHTLFEQLSVPLVIYGRKALENVRPPENIAGSHLDVLPTLIDLAAPAGFEYHALGRDLLQPSQLEAGFGCNAVIGSDFILKVSDPTHPQDLHGQPANNVDGKSFALRYRQFQALGWWRAMKGKDWPNR
ncbi:MAG TPA: LTA synthase family protein [Chthoniobacterales bacterium]|nr:LTA synthase family protein [Chthoniobacterales bacterium]